MKRSKKGFTLIELLVVIAIIAILSVVVILTLNPAELLRQSRDSNRVSDLSILKSAVSYYLVSVSVPTIGSSTPTCSMSAPVGNATTSCTAWFQTTTATTTASSTQINGQGWLPINFTTITAGGSPIGALGQDPSAYGNNGNTFFYSYTASSSQNTFKLDAHMESSKYGKSGSNDVVSTDGGIDSNSYEVGTNLQL